MQGAHEAALSIRGMCLVTTPGYYTSKISSARATATAQAYVQPMVYRTNSPLPPSTYPCQGRMSERHKPL